MLPIFHHVFSSCEQDFHMRSLFHNLLAGKQISIDLECEEDLLIETYYCLLIAVVHGCPLEMHGLCHLL